jgi:beta-galactosidase
MFGRREFVKGSAAAMLYSVSPKCFPQTSGSAGRVSYDDRSVMIDGRRRMLTCGEVHYPRSTRAMWPTVLERSKSLGLNTISTYVFWNMHEPSRGVYDFTGERDLGHYLDTCQEKGLDVFLRVGPYICAEWNFGGFPPYLRDEPGITIRTMDKPYTDRVEAFFEKLAPIVLPRLASKGGPIILVQVENEYANVAKRYGDAGQEYLRWIVELATRVGFAGVPTTTCEGGAQGAIETSNGFMIPPERIAAVRKSHPGTPLLWTELYPAWYRVWGGGIVPARDVRSMAGGILDFVSRGGSGFSYYMWHGGSNFGRTSMYLQTPTYDFFAPLDEYGGITETGVYLGRLHAVLEEQSANLLGGDRSDSMQGAQRVTTWRRGSEELRLIQDNYQDHPPSREQARLMNLHARLEDGRGTVLFDLDEMHETVARSYTAAEWKPVAQPSGEALVWHSWDEPLPEKRHDAGLVAADPVEQLSLTKDATDYCWYSTEVDVREAGAQQIDIPYGGDFFYVYLDGHLVASSELPLEENRGPITPEDPAHPRASANISEEHHPHGFHHTFALPVLTAGKHRLDLLACALGMIKGDWQIASPMNFERKGIWEGVQWNGKPLQGWVMRTGLVGEERMLPMHAGKIHGRSGLDEPRTLRWYATKMQVPASTLSSGAVFRLDASGLGKGMLWVNGKAVGRHWLIAAKSPQDTASQRYYHVPADWLRPVNEVVVFEEQSATPAGVQLQLRMA